MSKPHFTLMPSFNIAVIATTGVVASTLLLFSHPRPFLSVALGILAGVVTGALQRRSVRLSPGAFAQAKSALEMRRAFMSNQPGKLSIRLVWGTGIVLLVVAFVQMGSPPISLIAGYASFMVARELVSFGAIGTARRNSAECGHAF